MAEQLRPSLSAHCVAYSNCTCSITVAYLAANDQPDDDEHDRKLDQREAITIRRGMFYSTRALIKQSLAAASAPHHLRCRDVLAQFSATNTMRLMAESGMKSDS